MRRIRVDGEVLFGDKEDVRLQNAGEIGRNQTERCTIIYKMKRFSHAVPGYYLMGNIDGDHIFYHESLSLEKIKEYLYAHSGHDDIDNPNVINRYDWCHYRNWGAKEPRKDGQAAPVSDESDEDEEAQEARWKRRRIMHFVSVGRNGSETYAIDRIEMGPATAGGEWNFGLKLQDKESKKHFVFLYGNNIRGAEMEKEHQQSLIHQQQLIREGKLKLFRLPGEPERKPIEPDSKLVELNKTRFTRRSNW